MLTRDILHEHFYYSEDEYCSEISAALARDRMAEEFFGQYAKLNFPELGQW